MSTQRRWAISAAAAAAIGALVIWWLATPHSYEDCVLAHLPGTDSEWAATEIMRACREKYGEVVTPQPAASDVEPLSPAKRIEPTSSTATILSRAIQWLIMLACVVTVPYAYWRLFARRELQMALRVASYVGIVLLAAVGSFVLAKSFAAQLSVSRAANVIGIAVLAAAFAHRAALARLEERQSKAP